MEIPFALENCRIDRGVGGPAVSPRSLVVLAGVAVTGVFAGGLVAVSSGSGPVSAWVAGLLAALAFAAGALVVARTPGEPARRAPDPELEAARRETRAARAELAALESSVAHDLRSPVGAVLNFATVLELDHGASLEPEGREIVKRIRRSAEAALNRLDALSRLAGITRAPLRLAPVEVEPLVRRAFAEARPGGPRVALTVDSLPERATADPELLRTAFTELFDNALKFSGPRPEPHIAVGGRQEPDGTCVYWVSDDGVGFDMRFADKLFGVFERLHGRDEFPGAGVGLAIVRRVAERHGGRAWIEAEPDRGARVFLALPERKEAA